MKSITVRVSALVLATTFASFHAQTASATSSAQRRISQQQLRAMGFSNLQEYIDQVEVQSAVATLGSADNPTSMDYDLIMQPTTSSGAGLPVATPVPGQIGGTSTNPNDPTHAPSGATGTWPPAGGTTIPPVSFPGEYGSPLTSGLNGILASITGLDINGWIAIGNTILNLITSNQPTVTSTLQPLSILPQSQPDWTQMSGWSAPVVQPCVIALVNSRGESTYSIPFTISFNANGNLSGAGHFIANLHAEPGQFQANAFYRVDLSTSVQSAVNMGTVANPIPGVEMDAALVVHTMLTDKRIVKKYFIRGDGRVNLMTAIAGPAL